MIEKESEAEKTVSLKNKIRDWTTCEIYEYIWLKWFVMIKQNNI